MMTLSLEKQNTVDMELLNEALSSFQTNTGCDYYELLTDNNVRDNYHKQYSQSELEPYVKEHEDILDFIECLV